MNRIEINVITGQSQVIALTPEEEAEAIARHDAIEAIEAPRRARLAADEADTAEAKVDAQVQMFLNFTRAQLDTWVETNITGAGNKTAFKVLGRLAQAAARGRVLR